MAVHCIRVDSLKRARSARAALLLLFLASRVDAQYFERNKVQYGSFDFSVLTTAHFRILHYPQGSPAVMNASRVLEKWYARHADFFGYGIQGLQKVILYDSTIDFQQTNVIFGLISQGEGGVTESLMHRMVLPLTGTPQVDAHVLAHELVHAFQLERISPPGAFASVSVSLPLWFMEGQAEYLSLGADEPLTGMWMRDAVLNGDVPRIDELSSKPQRYFPYRFGQELWAWIDAEWGRKAMRDFFNVATRSGIPSAVQSVLGMKDMDEFSRRWRGHLTATYMGRTSGRTLPRDVGRMLPGLGSGLNIGPVISPDGRYIAVFSQRDLFGLDLFLADAETGRVLTRLAGGENDARWDVLGFIDSAGAWSPDSRSLAFGVEKGGRDAVAIVSVPSAEIQKIIPLGGIKGVTGLAWSPDGRRIAFSGTRDSLRDIYLLDPGTEEVERVTEGWHAEIQPAWSPDGRTLAFATDQGAATDLAALSFQSMNIGIMDVQSRQIRVVSLKDGATHINPVFSPDGKSLYFIANPDGFPDLYRYDLAAQGFFRVTRVATGISGLTTLSPCLSLTRETGDLVFTIFNNRKYEVHVLPRQDAQGTPVESEGAAALPLFFPGVDLPFPAAAPGLGLAAYKPAFSILAASQIGVGLSVSPFGLGIGGAGQVSFADVLGDHEIDVAAQASGSLDSVGALVAYINRTGRVNWGLSVSHFPEVSYLYLPTDEIADPQADMGIAQRVIFVENASLLVQYPLSTNRRLEAILGYSHIWWEQTVPVFYYQNGTFLDEDQLRLSTPGSLDLVRTGVAYVGDYSDNGFTGPIRGSRYRFEIDQDVGTVYFTTALVDARLYLFLNPLTFAFRGMFEGRFFGGAENRSLTRFYVGDPVLVRGYDYSSITAHEGSGAVGVTPPEVDRLLGSKIAVFNAELRIPILGNDSLGLIRFPWLPTELVAFFDAGMAWTEGQFPRLILSTDPRARIPVFSAGGALRFNLLGAFVLQLYYAWPFERPGVGGVWGLLIAEGW